MRYLESIYEVSMRYLESIYEVSGEYYSQLLLLLILIKKLFIYT